MVSQSQQTLKLIDPDGFQADVLLVRDEVQLEGRQASTTADHMTVSYATGNQVDLIFFYDSGRLTAKRLVQKIDFTVPRSTHIPATSKSRLELGDLRPEEERKYLSMYQRFLKP